MPMLQLGWFMPADAVALQLAINHLVPDLQQSNVSPEIAEWSHLVGYGKPPCGHHRATSHRAKTLSAHDSVITLPSISKLLPELCWLISNWVGV